MYLYNEWLDEKWDNRYLLKIYSYECLLCVFACVCVREYANIKRAWLLVVLYQNGFVFSYVLAQYFIYFYIVATLLLLSYVRQTLLNEVHTYGL